MAGGPAEGGQVGAGGYGEALLAAYRELRPGALPRLVNTLSSLIGGSAVLLDGAAQVIAGTADAQLLGHLGQEIDRVASRRARSAAVDVDALTAEVLSVGEAEPYAVLVVVRQGPFTPELRALVSHIGHALWQRWRLDTIAADERRLAEAARRLRNGVLQQLMSGDIAGARRTAGAMGPPLADTVRVSIVECAAGRGRVAAQCSEACGGEAWIVPCPVYSHHLIVIAPAGEKPEEEGIVQALKDLAHARDDVYVGISRDAALSQTPDAYQEAMHALAVARSDPERATLFISNVGVELATALGDEAPPWALRLLTPLLQYKPSRHGDPDATELAMTLGLWLLFGTGAAALLQLHRNTLDARLRRIAALLERDLTPIGTQAALYLALRLVQLRLSTKVVNFDAAADAGLDDLLVSPAAAGWADKVLAPLMDDANATLLQTVRAWLGHDAQAKPAALALGRSVPAVRKRLARVERLLGLSLLTSPSATSDLWLALRSHDLREAARSQ